MNTFDQRRCAICGAVISDENPDGIGFSCREVYQKASWQVFFSDDSRRSEYYYLKNKPLVERFIETLSNTKFRSKFWKGFYPSICEQWREKRFVSRKQFEIIWNRLFQEGIELQSLCDAGRDAGKALYEKWRYNETTLEETEHIINLANKLRHKEAS